MFINRSRRWCAGTEQRASGTFLLLCLPRTPAAPIKWKCPWTSYKGEEDTLGRKCSTELVRSTEALAVATCPGCGRVSREPHWHAGFKALRAFVRHVQLRQCGHWMMGDMAVHGERVALSGTYGGDGLPTEVSRETWEHGLPLPSALIETYRTAKGGHNSAGSEGQAIRDWAAKNLKGLRAASRKGAPTQLARDIHAEEET